LEEGVPRSQSAGAHQQQQLPPSRGHSQPRRTDDSGDLAGQPSRGDQNGKDSEQSAAERVKTVAAETFERTKETVKESTSRAAERFQEQGASWAATQKERIAEELSHVSYAFRQATDSLRHEDDQNVAAVTQLVAEQTSRVADYVRSGDVSRFRDDAEQFARRRPEVFFGGLFLVGLALSRFLKARPVSRQSRSDEIWDDMGLVSSQQFTRHDGSAR